MTKYLQTGQHYRGKYMDRKTPSTIIELKRLK